MKPIRNILSSLFFTARLYILVGVNVFLFVMSYLFEGLYILSWSFLWLLIFATMADLLVLFMNRKGIEAERFTFYKLSNGDENEIGIQVDNNYGFRIKAEVIDELPEQFQYRYFSRKLNMSPQSTQKFNYAVRPVSRGEYHFGSINVLVKTVLGLAERKFKTGKEQILPCYPSFLKLRQYELLTINGRLTDLGIKKTRRIGNSTEFDHIKEYVIGNDIRTINWKATARRNQLMVNHYRDERAQQVYSVIDMGRIMKMPFDGLTLLDYSINSSLVLSHVSYIKHDKPGLIAFSNEMAFYVNADRKGNQLFRLQEALYNAKTNFYETNYESLLVHLRAKVTQRSLLLLYTNFETVSGLRRQLKYIRQIAKSHLLVVIIFENTELDKLLTKNAANTYEIYLQTIARKFDYEKHLVALELQKYGIQCIYTKPADLTVNAINKYLELKSRGLI